MSDHHNPNDPDHEKENRAPDATTARGSNEVSRNDDGDDFTRGTVLRKAKSSPRGGGGVKAERRRAAEYLAATGGGEIDDYLPKDDRAEGLWALPTVRAYLTRINAQPRSLLRAAVVEPGGGRYARDVATIKFARDGTVAAPDEYAPTAEEQAAIRSEVENVVLPKQVTAPANAPPPDEIDDVPAVHRFDCRARDGSIMCWQVRRDYDGRRVFNCYSFYDDGRWRLGEPEDGLPLFGLEMLRDDTETVFLHEGAKSARAARNMKADHPWVGDMSGQGRAHLGWIGGAPNPHRTDWSSLAQLSNVKRFIIVADNDDVGRSAVPKIAKMLRKLTYAVYFTDEFPKGFDLADDFPADMFARADTLVERESVKKLERQYRGPSFESCLRPATWLTDLVKTGERGRPSYRLREHAKNMWVWVRSLEKFACYDRPTQRYKAEALNTTLRQVAHVKGCADLISESARQVDGLCYRPDKPQEKIVASDDGQSLNLYRPSTLRAVKGDVGRWEKFLERLFPIKEEREWVRRWCATLIAKPEVRMKIALLLISETQGTGKSTLAKVMRRLVGEHNCSEPSANHIVDNDFNGWIVEKRLVIVHEIYEGHSWKAYNKLKSLISEETVQASLKYEQAFTIDNWANFILCSNDLGALKIEGNDRRIFIPKVTEDKWAKAEADVFYDWFNAGGDAIIKQWALDFGDCHPENCEVLMTALKSKIAEASKSDVVVYGEMIAEAMLKKPTGEKNDLPLAVSAARLLRAAVENSPPKAFAPGALSFANSMVRAGLSYVDERLKI